MKTYKASPDVASVVIQIVNHIYGAVSVNDKPNTAPRVRPVDKFSMVEVTTYGDKSTVTQVKVTGTLLHPLNFHFNIDNQRMSGLVITMGDETYSADMSQLLKQLPILNGLFMDLVGTIQSERIRAVSTMSQRMSNCFLNLSRVTAPLDGNMNIERGSFEDDPMSIRDTVVGRGIIRDGGFARANPTSVGGELPSIAPSNCAGCGGQCEGFMKARAGLKPKETPQHIDYDGFTIGSLSEITRDRDAATRYYQHVTEGEKVNGFLLPYDNDNKPVLLLNKRLFYPPTLPSVEPTKRLPLVLFNDLEYTVTDSQPSYVDTLLEHLSRCPGRLASDLKTLTGYTLTIGTTDINVHQINVVLPGTTNTTPGVRIERNGASETLTLIRRPDSHEIDLLVELTDPSGTEDGRFPMPNWLNLSVVPSAVQWYETLSQFVTKIIDEVPEPDSPFEFPMWGHIHYSIDGSERPGY